MSIVKKTMSDEAFGRSSKILILEYVDLVKKGLPDEEVVHWAAKLDQLPDPAKSAILNLVEINPFLKDALSGRGELFSTRGGKSR